MPYGFFADSGSSRRLLKKERNPNDEYHYELLLVYVYDVLCCFHNPQLIMDKLDFPYDMKDWLMGLQEIYLGTEMKKYQVRRGKYH